MANIFSTGSFGRSLVSDEFNKLCTDMRVEARVTALPNPGDPYHAMRVIHMRSFNNCTVLVTQKNKKQTKTRIAAMGECDIMLFPDEEMPLIEKEEGTTDGRLFNGMGSAHRQVEETGGLAEISFRPRTVPERGIR